MKKFNEAEARQLVLAAFAEEFGREATTLEAQCLQAISGLETGHGSGWKGAGAGSFNMGAIQKGSWPYGVFTYTDTHPEKDGASTPYTISFRRYVNAVAGFADLAHVVYAANDRRKAALVCAGKGDLLGFSTELHKYPCYYEGFGATDADRIAHHHNAVLNQIQAQCAELGEAMPEATPLPVIAPALLIGCTGEAVKLWQKIVGATVDGSFGLATATATRAWQTNHGLPPSGVVCVPELQVAGFWGAS